MLFAQAWTQLDIGDKVIISNGKPPPSFNKTGKPYKIWRSHNFTGILVSKDEVEGWRSMLIEFENELGNTIGYRIQEEVGHQITKAPPNA